MAAYHCKDCDFKTEETLVFEQHINENHSPKRESREKTSSEETSSEGSNIENYVGATYCFEPNLSLKSFQHTSACTGTKENLQSVSYLKESTTHNSDFKQTDETPLYYCAECSYNTKRKKSLKHHTKKMHPIKRYACDKCPYKCKRKLDLQGHIKRKHLGGERYKCQKCSFKTKAKAYLRQHINYIHLTD